MKLKLDILRILTITLIASLALVYPLLWMKMLADPVLNTGADYIAFYAAGRIADNEGAARAYDLHLQQKYEREVVGFDFEFSETTPFVHPPFVLPFAQFAATPNYLASFQRWAFIMVIIFAAGIPFLLSVTGVSFFRAEKITLALSLFLFFPSFQSIILGQDNALMFLGLALWLWGLYQNKNWAAGLGLALTTVRPHLALFLLAGFLFKRRAVLGWFALFAFALGLISLAVAGFGGAEGFLRILTVSGGGENFKINEEDMINLIGILRRAFPTISSDVTRVVGWGSYALALASLTIYHWRSGGNLESDISLAAISAVFFSPHSHVQDLLLLLVPIIALIYLLLAKRIILPSRAALIPLGVSLLLLFSYSSPALTHFIPYLLMMVLLYFVWHYHKGNPEVLLLGIDSASGY